MMEAAHAADIPEPLHGGQDPTIEIFPRKDKEEADEAVPIPEEPLAEAPAPAKKRKVSIKPIWQ